jgi:hypothetical protein
MNKGLVPNPDLVDARMPNRNAIEEPGQIGPFFLVVRAIMITESRTDPVFPRWQPGPGDSHSAKELVISIEEVVDHLLVL